MKYALLLTKQHSACSRAKPLFFFKRISTPEKGSGLSLPIFLHPAGPTMMHSRQLCLAAIAIACFMRVNAENSTNSETSTTAPTDIDRIPAARATIASQDGTTSVKSNGFNIALPAAPSSTDFTQHGMFTSKASGTTADAVMISATSCAIDSSTFTIGTSTASIACDNSDSITASSATTVAVQAQDAHFEADSVSIRAKETLALTGSSAVKATAKGVALDAVSATIAGDDVQITAGSASVSLSKTNMEVTAADVTAMADAALEVTSPSVTISTSDNKHALSMSTTNVNIKSATKTTLKSTARTMDADAVIAVVADMRTRVANLKAQLAAKKQLLNSMMQTQETEIESLETTYDDANIAQDTAESALETRLSASEAQLNRSDVSLEADLDAEVTIIDNSAVVLETKVSQADAAQAKLSGQESTDQAQVAGSLNSLETALSQAVVDLASEQTALGKSAAAQAATLTASANKMGRIVSTSASTAVANGKPEESSIVSLDAGVNKLDGDVATLRSDVSKEVSRIDASMPTAAVSAQKVLAAKMKTDTGKLSAAVSTKLPNGAMVANLADTAKQLNADVPKVKTNLQELLPSDVEVDFPVPTTVTRYFGQCAHVGSVFACGASYQDTVSIFTVTNGKPVRNAIITDPSPYKQYHTYFGENIAMQGDIMVVGAYQDRSSLFTYGSGSAYIYTRSSKTSGTAYTQRTRMQHSSPNRYDYCGGAVTVSGLFVSMMCYGDDTPRSSTGTLVVYRRASSTSTSFSRASVFYLSSSQARYSSFQVGARFVSYTKGPMVTKGSLVFVGAPYAEQSSSYSSEGLVIVYRVRATTSTSTSTSYVQAVYKTSNRYRSAYCGSSLAQHGNFLFVGCPRSRGTSTYVGSVLIYAIGSEASSSPLTYQAEIVPPYTTRYTNFGGQISISDDGLYLSVGANRANSGRGTVYFYKRNGSDWKKKPTTARTYAPTTGPTSDQWGGGFNLWISDKYQIIGSPYADNYKGAVRVLSKRDLFP
eukprot:TRINITY_DN10860_c0_g2_i3.p1 TRINITY_DN10860_c0_g2~~TRINITY_DN10860_c0_g2_i3.p1  ORF type:complete len:999 (+),score=297.58 TRINITY_DN10860_c0_g2_i3:33-3029(+)